MELMTLNSTFQPDRLVENYESLIWTERYDEAGDFELVSSDIPGMMDLLPRESYLTLRESTVPMIVETHKIVKGPRQAPQITITGRSFETVLERRACIRTITTPGNKKSEWKITASSSSDAAFLAMRYILGDIPQYKSGVQVLPQRTSPNPLDAIPQIGLILPVDYLTAAWSSTITYNPTATVSGIVVPGDYVGVGTTIYQAIGATDNLNKPPATSPTYWTAVYTGQPGIWGVGSMTQIEASDLYAIVMNLLKTNHHGIKSVRPLPGGTQVGIEIYNGGNFTGEGDTGDPNNVVVFDARFDQFDSATYLLSQQGSTNVAYVYGNANNSISDTVLKNVTDATHLEPSGLQRRVLLVDGSDDSSLTTVDGIKSRGLVELYQHNVTALVDGEISEQVGAGFNRNYFLGDLLKLIGEYGLTQNVRVAEFIRTSDATGEKAYPAFEAIE